MILYCWTPLRFPQAAVLIQAKLVLLRKVERSAKVSSST